MQPPFLEASPIWSVLRNFDRIKMGMNGWTFFFFLNPRQIGSPTETQNKNGGLTMSDGNSCKNKWSKQRRWGFQWSSAKLFDLEEHLQETMDLSHQAGGFLSFFPSALLQKRRNTSCGQFPNFPKKPAGCKIGYSIMDTVTKKYQNGGFLDFNFWTPRMNFAVRIDS